MHLNSIKLEERGKHNSIVSKTFLWHVSFGFHKDYSMNKIFPAVNNKILAM